MTRDGVIGETGEPFLREMLLRLEIASEEIRESKAVINQVVMQFLMSEVPL